MSASSTSKKRKRVFLIPTYKEAPVEFVELERNSTLNLGRGEFGITDKTVSRTQAVVDIDGEHNVVLRTGGVNPVYITSGKPIERLLRFACEVRY